MKRPITTALRGPSRNWIPNEALCSERAKTAGGDSSKRCKAVCPLQVQVLWLNPEVAPSVVRFCAQVLCLDPS